MNTDRHSFKSDQTDALSLSVYNVGYEKCQGLHSWGSGVRDHYLIHHIISGKGVYKTPQGEYHLSAGDTFLIYPYTVITYTADKNDPWEYYWAGFNGSDAEFILDRAGFTRECPVISADFGSELKDSLERIYRLSGNRPCENDRSALHHAGHSYGTLGKSKPFREHRKGICNKGEKLHCTQLHPWDRGRECHRFRWREPCHAISSFHGIRGAFSCTVYN